MMEKLDPATASVAVDDNVRRPHTLRGAEEDETRRVEAAVGLLLLHGSIVPGLNVTIGVAQASQEEVLCGPVAGLDELPVLLGHLRVRQAVGRVQVIGHARVHRHP